MKHLFNNTYHLVVLACLSVLLFGCEQDPKFKKYEYPMPEVSTVYPTTGYVTSQVVITGTNFGDRTEAVKVFFGETQSTNVLMCKNNRIVVEVPENAMSGDVSLQIWTNKVEAIGKYNVLPTPYILSVESDGEDGSGIAAAGDKVTIIGENFGTDASVISVSFNGTPAEDFTLDSEKQITAITPAGYQSGNVIVTIRSYAMTGAAMFNPESKGDVTPVYLINYKQPFASRDENPGDWSEAFGWNQNAASLNATGCRQNEKGTTYLTFQKGWGKTDINDGKIWQSAKLRKGSYRLEATYTGSYVPNSNGNSVIALIVKGTDDSSIPVLADIATLDDGKNGVYVAFNNWDGAEGTLKTSSFTLDEITDVVVGFLVTIKSSNTYFKVTGIKLILE